MRVLVAIPAFNEEKTVGAVISGVPRTIPGVSCVDILVVDDGSSDSTAGVAAGAGARVCRHPGNRGLGAVFRTALAEAREGGYDVLATIDGDGQFDPSGVGDLLAPILAGGADMVTCSRFMPGSGGGRIPWVRRTGNR